MQAAATVLVFLHLNAFTTSYWSSLVHSKSLLFDLAYTCNSLLMSIFPMAYALIDGCLCAYIVDLPVALAGVNVVYLLASSAENVVSWQQSGQCSHCSGPAITAHGSLDFKQEIYIQIQRERGTHWHSQTGFP
jgi:hypothetical protein